MKEIIKQAIIDTHFYDSMQKTNVFETSKFMTFESIELSKTDNIELRKQHELIDEDEFLILFYREFYVGGDFWTANRTYTYSTIFLENRISFYKQEYKHGSGVENEWSSEIFYKDIESVEVYDKYIRFFYTKEHIAELKKYWSSEIKNEKDSNLRKLWQDNYDNCEYCEREPKYFGLENFNYKDPIEPFFIKIKEGISSLENDYEQSKENYQIAINEAFEAEDYQKAHSILEEYNFLEDYYFFKYDLAYTFSMLDEDVKAVEVLNILIESAEEQEVNYWAGKAKMFKSTFLEASGDYYDALQLFNDGLKGYEDKESSGYYSEERSKELYTKYLESFKELPYKDRKVIYITNSTEKYKSDTLTVLQANHLPDISFPAHHPINNETYIGHPYNNNLYIPIQNYDNELLIDRINEFCYLLQCLGAESITIENINSDNNSKQTNHQNNVNVGVSSLKAGIEVDNKNTQKKSSENQISLRIGRNQTFNPTKFPYIPNDLTWLTNEAGWQRLIKQRLGGSLLEHNEFMSSNQSQILNTNEINDLKVDLKVFFNKANVNVKKDIDAEIKNSSSTEWKVQVKFKPIDQFVQQTLSDAIEFEELPVTTGNNNEVEFIEEYKFLIADGELSERDQRILNRLRQKLNITEERASELITTLNNYSDKEKELIEEINFMLQDGEISEREERILLRLASKIGVPHERCLELIKNMNK
ncbi:TerB family tellurite resistance protein [Flavobacterium sp. CBA20B-1]|uniref:TerB family tellurite resistance protein n=1 Tax=unclassified Flavobacterium TaxID=196869 RepID=UPI002224FBE3|nr:MULTISPECIES: TerB family tellurite resistance protein [unclassified Flavobacterium]WCM42113.1 TerB family tellurite resistance protein [Flavobacterium sp. CBA20B-1]